jgi:ELP3 family radical SAM enzyme/protein acetyltransferase
MSCISQRNNIDIPMEDLLLDRDQKHITSIYDNMGIYKTIIRDIIKWISSKSHIKNFDYIQKFNIIYSKFINKYRVFCKKSILLSVYRNMLKENEVEDDPLLWRLLQKRPARNMSGVTVITILTSPYPNGQTFSCKHNCYYCPDEPGQPRSYLKKEPAVARANRNKFDPILQTEDRIKSLIICGHEIDKLEFIIEGGTYTEYPPDYLEEFHRDFIYCVNTYFDEMKREKLTIQEEININKTASIKIIGICIETRPDALFEINEKTGERISWLRRFREWGVTRVQLGVQHTDNTILKKVNRGHTIEQAQEGIKYLKDNCFKVDIHLMPDLPFTTPEKDKAMIDYVFDTPHLQPDQAKIYFCEVTPWTVIQKWHKSGKYKPYAQTDEKALFDVAKYVLRKCPPWVRIPRVIRDIPLTYIEGGNMYPNLRQMLSQQLEDEGFKTMDIRARECGRNTKYNPEEAVMKVRTYEANGGIDKFISFESEDENCIFGFLRLRLSPIINDIYNYNINNTTITNTKSTINTTNTTNTTNTNIEFSCLKNKALIRELHVYGNVVPVGYKNNNIEGRSQHMGFGKRLLEEAEKTAQQNGYNGIAVISGIGVMEYYEKCGYYYDDTFMIKDFKRMDPEPETEHMLTIWKKVIQNREIFNFRYYENENSYRQHAIRTLIDIIITVLLLIMYFVISHITPK